MIRNSKKILTLLFFLIGFLFVLPPAAGLASTVFGIADDGSITEFPMDPKAVVLTFDDGPSEYTPQILDILREKDVKATFFVIGRQIIDHPEILERAVAEGHEIGNHTYSHVNLLDASDWRIRTELNLNRLIIEHATGRDTRLFRPPFFGSDAISNDPRKVRVIGVAGRAGYLTIGENIDSDDWARPGIDEIVQYTTVDENGGIILFHDGGGERSQTIGALPRIIDYYKSQGYSFQTLGESVAGLSPQTVMPDVGRRDAVYSGLVFFLLEGFHSLGTFLTVAVVILLAGNLLRLLLLVPASLIQFRRRRRRRFSLVQPFCSVIVPAYNEEAVIKHCLASLLASDYPDFEVLLVDDGSHDATVEVAREIGDPRLRILKKPNGGKASALNYGIAAAGSEIIVAIDADSVFKKDSLRKLVRNFTSPEVGAVSGNVQVANRNKLLTRMQSLEYVIGFNLDRRMGDLLNCITIIPGAIGAFRKEAIAAVGGFSVHTLAEDADLTLSIREMGYRVVYDEEAVAFTEVPSSARDLLKQRFRWTFGIMQAAWKHKRTCLNPKRGTLGLVGLPYLILFQIVFPLISPFFDLAIIYAFLTGHFELMMLAFVLYTMVDSVIALILERQGLKQLWLIIPQKVIYRQLISYVMLKSLFRVLKGQLVSWGKLIREGKQLAKI